MTTFTVHYTPEQAVDPLISPDEIMATAEATHAVSIGWDSEPGSHTVRFTVAEGASDEVAHLLKRLARHNLRVTDGEGNEVSAS